ncbi:MAG: hypothetical protein ACE366_20675 [Bradymonadia bacterium]
MCVLGLALVFQAGCDAGQPYDDEPETPEDEHVEVGEPRQTPSDENEPGEGEGDRQEAPEHLPDDIELSLPDDIATPWDDLSDEIELDTPRNTVPEEVPLAPACNVSCFGVFSENVGDCVEAGGVRAICNDEKKPELVECLSGCHPDEAHEEERQCPQMCEEGAKTTFHVCVDLSVSEDVCKEVSEEDVERCVSSCQADKSAGAW